jgi:allantoicase
VNNVMDLVRAQRALTDGRMRPAAVLRVYGDVIPDPALWEDVTVEVSGAEQGGRVEWSSDSFYSDACALIHPDRPRNMGDGWALVPFDVPVLPRTRIAPDARQVFVVEANDVNALRLQAYPDGGIARLRAFGRPADAGMVSLWSVWRAGA